MTRNYKQSLKQYYRVCCDGRRLAGKTPNRPTGSGRRERRSSELAVDAAAIVAARPTVIDYGVDALTIDPSNGVFNSLTTQDGRRLEFTAPGNSSMLNNNFSSNFKCNSSKKPENGGGGSSSRHVPEDCMQSRWRKREGIIDIDD